MKNSGFALLITLWSLVLLSVIAMHFSFSTRWGSIGIRNFKDDTQGYYLALSGYEDALAYLLTDTEPETDFVDEEGIFRTDTEREPISGSKLVDGTLVEISLTDEESRLNINRISRSTMKKLLERIEVPDDTVQIISDSIEDWKDPDDLHRLSGAEDTYYAEFGYMAKDSHFDVIEELLLVRDARPEYLFGTEETISLYPLSTTWGDGININTASSEVLEVIGLSKMEAEQVIRIRESSGPYKQFTRTLRERVTISSSNFRIEVMATPPGSNQSVKITSVVNRKIGADGPTLKTLYWKEDIESSGA